MVWVMERSERDDAGRLGAGFARNRGQEAALALAWGPPAPPEMELAGRERRGTKPVLAEAPVAGQVGAMCTLCERRRRRAALQPSAGLEIVGNGLTPALLLAGIMRNRPARCYDLAASEGRGQRCCLQGFERLLLAFLFQRVSTEIRDMLFFASSFLGLRGSRGVSVQVFCSQLKRLRAC